MGNKYRGSAGRAGATESDHGERGTAENDSRDTAEETVQIALSRAAAADAEERADAEGAGVGISPADIEEDEAVERVVETATAGGDGASAAVDAGGETARTAPPLAEDARDGDAGDDGRSETAAEDAASDETGGDESDAMEDGERENAVDAIRDIEDDIAAIEELDADPDASERDLDLEELHESEETELWEKVVYPAY